MEIQPLCVPPKVAGQMLGYGLTRVYSLLKSGELVSFLDGGARRITTESITAYVARKLETGSKPVRRGPGRPKKTSTEATTT